MAEWYDFNDAGANEVGANEVGANEVGANEVGANEVGANEVGANEVGANEVGANNYFCNCGCNLEFIEYGPGFDLYVGNKWIMMANAMVHYKWRNYIRLRQFNLWNDFRENIIRNYNNALNNDPVKPEDAAWIHLYNQEITQENNIPLNEKLYYEYVY
jgi:hypothetical protein